MFFNDSVHLSRVDSAVYLHFLKSTKTEALSCLIYISLGKAECTRKMNRTFGNTIENRIIKELISFHMDECGEGMNFPPTDSGSLPFDSLGVFQEVTDFDKILTEKDLFLFTDRLFD